MIDRVSQSPDRRQQADIQVLLVDDDKTWVESTAQILEHQREQFTVEPTTTKAAAETTLTTQFDCIVCDYDLGNDETGLELLSDVRTADDDRPFILITGQGDESVASDAISRRVTDYIPKRSLGGHSDLLARRIETAVDAYRTRQALARERRSKDAMLDILRSVSSQEGLLQQYCDHIHCEHGYECVWIGTTDDSLGVIPQAVAGREDYPNEALDPGSETTSEPAVVAATQNETQTIPELTDTAVDAHWKDVALARGFEGAIATPLVHDGTTFGVLAAYDSTPRFGTGERTLLEEYGETIGYAIRTTNWKETLLAAQPVAVTVEIYDEDVPLVALNHALPLHSQIEVLTTVSREETLLYLLHVSGVRAETLRAQLDNLDMIYDGTISRESAPLRCEIEVDRPTPATELAEAGGRVANTTISGGGATITVLSTQSMSPQSLVESIQTAYSSMSIQSISGADATPDISGDGLLESLTEKQRRALEIAYFSGYFQRPRDNNTTEVAEKLGVSRQTLTQHLRAGEEKIFGDLFETNS